MTRNWIQTSFIFLSVTFLAGTFLRATEVFKISVDYRNFVHAHSHIGFLGWFTFLIYGLTEKYFLQNNLPKKAIQTLNLSYILLLFSCAGMLCSFPVQGYAFFSILFSSLHIIATYLISACMLKNLKNDLPAKVKIFLFIIFGFQFLASVGPWALGPIMTSSLRNTHWFQNIVYSYLHFLYHGFVLSFILFLSFIYPSESKKNTPKIFSGFFMVLISHFFTLSLSFLWMKPPLIFNFLATTGALLFLGGLFLIGKNHFSEYSKWKKISYTIFILKGLIMLAGSFPLIANQVASSRFLLLTYMHFTFLITLTFPFLVMTYDKTGVRASNQTKIIFLTLSSLLLIIMILPYFLPKLIFANLLIYQSSLFVVSSLLLIWSFLLLRMTPKQE